MDRGRTGRVPGRHRHQLQAGADVRVAARAAEEWSVLTTEELRECGLPSASISVRARTGRLHRLHRGVYAVGHPNVPLEGRFLAAVKACHRGPRGHRGTGAAFLSNFSAAALWGFMEWEERDPEVTVIDGHLSHPRIRVHQTSRLAAHDVRWHKGIPVTSPARTLLDIAARLDGHPLRAAVRRALSLQLVAVRELAEVIDRHGPCRGSRRLARVIATGPAPTRSQLEDIVLDLLLRGGLAHPDVNKPLVIGGRRVIPDFRWPEQCLVVEADGAAWHDNKLAREDDAERQAMLEANGDRVLRVTWEQAVAHPSQTLARIRRAGAPPRTARVPPHCDLPRTAQTPPNCEL